jgi:hypothetical protein
VTETADTLWAFHAGWEQLPLPELQVVPYNVITVMLQGFNVTREVSTGGLEGFYPSIPLHFWLFWHLQQAKNSCLHGMPLRPL